MNYLTTEDGKPIKKDNPLDVQGTVQLSGSKATEPFSGSANTTKTFSQTMNGFVIINDGAADLTFTIGTDSFTVKPSECFKESFNAFTEVTITTTGAFRAYGLR
ncbi:MAG: hypothetical protein WCQ59_08375 [Candidatus Cloacimonadaceae bacterium]